MAIELGTPQSPEQGTSISIPIPSSLPVDPVTLTEQTLIVTGYLHPNHSGHISSNGDGDTTLNAAAITDRDTMVSGLASTDEFLINDSGILKRVDLDVLAAYILTGSGSGFVTLSTDQTVGGEKTWTEVAIFNDIVSLTGLGSDDTEDHFVAIDDSRGLLTKR